MKILTANPAQQQMTPSVAVAIVGARAEPRAPDAMNWLAPQAKEILQKEHDPKLAPPKVAEFALVLVRKGVAHRRIIRAVTEINRCSEADATGLVNRPTPVIINLDLTEEEALSGQSELICCDSISVFIRSEVLEQSDKAYLESLFKQVLQSIEFSPTTVRVIRVPESEAGAKFIDQFLGGRFPKRNSPVTLEVPFKKARMMKHRATQIGAEIQ